MLLFFLLFVVTLTVLLYLLRPTKTETAVQRHLEELKEAMAERPGETILKE
ncbi:MAG: hypothetical protein JO356_06175, partial [Acidobacteria bacterium]|nr:hypothetical protein [Acidobacteriota bacterium]